jgi:hypothetical protein
LISPPDAVGPENGCAAHEGASAHKMTPHKAAATIPASRLIIYLAMKE